MKSFYPVIFTKEDVGYSTTAVDLDGCFSEGDSFEEAYTNIQDAIGLYLEDMEKYAAAIGCGIEIEITEPPEGGADPHIK